jgi:hypothetical protein
MTSSCGMNIPNPDEAAVLARLRCPDNAQHPFRPELQARRRGARHAAVSLPIGEEGNQRRRMPYDGAAAPICWMLGHRFFATGHLRTRVTLLRAMSQPDAACRESFRLLLVL